MGASLAVAIVSRIKSLVRYDYKSHGILLHPNYKSETVSIRGKADVSHYAVNACLDGKIIAKLQIVIMREEPR